MTVLEDLADEECYLYALLTDPSGLDLAEFTWVDHENKDYCWRAWPFQWKWYRNESPLQVDQCARAVGKSLSIKMRMFCFPFLHPGNEAVITAPELVHLNPITGLIEGQFLSTRLGREMLPKGRNRGITHRPFQMDFVNGSRIIGRIPQRDGKGVKGCVSGDTIILTRDGFKFAKEIRVGDYVMSHKSRWQRVSAVYEDENDCYEVTGQGSFPFTVSCDHRFYGADNQSGPKRKRSFGELGWHDVEFLTDHKIYWATPTVFPSMDIPGGSLPVDDPDFWWLIGRWVADGFKSMDRARNKARKVHWVVHSDKQRLFIDKLATLSRSVRVVTRSHSSADCIEIGHAELYEWLDEHFGNGADGKTLPSWVFGMERGLRRALLDGYLSGDGHRNQYKRRWEAGTASKRLAVAIQLLAQSLGHAVNCTTAKPKTQEIRGVKLKNEPKVSWRVHIMDEGTGHAEQIDNYKVAKVRSVEPIGIKKIYDIRVENDHSYLTGSIMSHNIHPLWLEMDESQDYPEPGWVELIETLKRGSEGAVWRAHGVTKGVRDYFYKFTQPDSGWFTHRYSAMYRPNWTDDERQEKIEMYGSRDHPDYRRNVLGLHGDATNPLFVLHRLMQCVDAEESSDYNQSVYQHIRVNHEMLLDANAPIEHFLDFNRSHKKNKIFWIGMDVGYTNHPSEILVFAEVNRKGKDPLLQLMTRIHLERISHVDQVAAILHIIDWYQPKAFSMDKTGLGLPLFQDIQSKAPKQASIIKGYNFSSKIVVDFDTTKELDEFKGDLIKDAAIERNVLEAASDKLRELVDEQRLQLPWDRDLIGEFQGQTYKIVRDSMNLYGKKEFSKGKFHALDAARMAVLGYAQAKIETMMANEKHEAVIPMFITY